MSKQRQIITKHILPPKNRIVQSKNVIARSGIIPQRNIIQQPVQVQPNVPGKLVLPSIINQFAGFFTDFEIQHIKSKLFPGNLFMTKHVSAKHQSNPLLSYDKFNHFPLFNTQTHLTVPPGTSFMYFGRQEYETQQRNDKSLAKQLCHLFLGPCGFVVPTHFDLFYLK